MARVGMILVTSLLLIGMWAGCGGGENKEDIATKVAREWVVSSIDLVSDAVVELVIADRPALTQLVGGVIADQVRDNLSWTYSVPRELGGDRYMVTATAAAGLEIDLPVLGEKAYSASVPFDLEIDTDAEAVLDWSVDFGSARVEER